MGGWTMTGSWTSRCMHRHLPHSNTSFRAFSVFGHSIPFFRFAFCVSPPPSPPLFLPLPFSCCLRTSLVSSLCLFPLALLRVPNSDTSHLFLITLTDRDLDQLGGFPGLFHPCQLELAFLSSFVLIQHVAFREWAARRCEMVRGWRRWLNHSQLHPCPRRDLVALPKCAALARPTRAGSAGP